MKVFVAVLATAVTVVASAAEPSVMWTQEVPAANGFANASAYPLAALARDPAGDVVVGLTSRGPPEDCATIRKHSGLDGHEIWQRSICGVMLFGFVVRGDGDVVMASAPFYTPVRITRLAGSDGSVRWERTLVSPDAGAELNLPVLAVDAGGNALVATRLMPTMGGAPRLRIGKYAATDGAILWERTDLVSGLYVNEPSGIAVDDAGDASVVVNGEKLVSSYDDDWALVKFAAGDGSVLWRSVFDRGQNDYARRLALDAAGDAVVVGGSYVSNFDNVLKVVKLSGATGEVSWEQTRNSGGYDYGTDLVIGADGDVHISGSLGGRFTAWSFAASGGLLRDASHLSPHGFYSSQASSLALLPDGRLGVAGYEGGPSSTTPGRVMLLDAYATQPSWSVAFTGNTPYNDALGAVALSDGLVVAWSSFESPSHSIRLVKYAIPEVAHPPRLSNLSTRLQALTGNDAMITGFVIAGSAPKTVVVRARGPSLAPFGIDIPLANPSLQLVRSSDQTTIAVNDDWQSAQNAAAIAASGFAPSDPLEAAILMTLDPGAYTALVSGAGGSTGAAIAEIFELDGPTVPLTNVSTRGPVLTGNDVMIGGFVIEGDGPQAVVVRARGPSLAPFGITNALANPQLRLVRSADQAEVAYNDDWQAAANAADIAASGFAPSNGLESAILITLQTGAYTAIVSGVAGGTGVAIVEVFRN